MESSKFSWQFLGFGHALSLFPSFRKKYLSQIRAKVRPKVHSAANIVFLKHNFAQTFPRASNATTTVML